MSTMISFADNSLATNFLTNDELRSICPAAFKESPTNPNVSGKYIQANTATVIEDLGKLGWYPVQAKQNREKKGSSGIRSFHMVAFQNPDIKIVKKSDDGGEIVDAYPRIILTNSHDGFNSFKFMVGCFRLVCSNGMVCGTDDMVNMSIRHINYTFEALRVVVQNAINEIPNIVQGMNKMREIVATDEMKTNLATEVLKIRKNITDDTPFQATQDEINDILTPVREEDKENNLWTLFNICQEKMIKGGFSSLGKNSRYRKQRRITSIKKDLDYNTRLWEAVSKYVPEYEYVTV